jgi:hypothetical protein
MQTTLFGEFEEKKEKGLKIVAKGEKPLSKNQKMFNSLTRRIETLENEIVTENQKLSKLLELHNKGIIPLENKVAHSRIKLAMTLAKSIELNKFTKKQTETIGEAIVTLCDDAFSDIEPTPELEAFYDRWSKVPYKLEIEQQNDDTKEEFADFMSDLFGIDIDMDDFDGSAESYARFQQKINDEFDQAQSQKQHQNHKKSKKQQAREEAQKEKEDIKNKSIRSIYIALVKILHPDTETDLVIKAEKDEIMKKVTVAYDQKDLTTLLKLEMEWVHKTSEHLEILTDDKLRIYIAALKQQASELEQEKFSLYHHPRYAKVSYFGGMSEQSAIREIQIVKSELKTILDNLNIFITHFERPNAKKQILEFVNEYFQQHIKQGEYDYLNDLPF